MALTHHSNKKPSKMTRIRRRLRSRGSLLPVVVMVAILIAVVVPLYKLFLRVRADDNGSYDIWDSDSDHEGEEGRGGGTMFRDLYSQEAWPGVEWNGTQPSQTHHTVHYLWCGRKMFRFQHYLAILSILRTLQPLKLVLHYTHLPLRDPSLYHTWFSELRQSLPSLELRALRSPHPCGSVAMLREGLRILSPSGGVLVGEGVVLSSNTDRLKLLPFWFAFADPQSDPTRGVVFVNTGFNQNTLEDYVQVILANSASCVTVEDFDLLDPEGSHAEGHAPLCVGVTEDVYPRDIRSSDAPFAELCRWLYYGRRDPFSTPHSGLVDTVPRLSHYVWLSSEGQAGELSFVQYLSVLSALHVAQMDHVYFHGDTEPRGTWWEALSSENVSFVRLDPPRSVFQQVIGVPAHVSDIVRYSVLYKYGGVYQDSDVIWVNRLPDWLLGYPTVACYEWPSYGQWPDTLNLGVVLARRHAPFLRHFLSTYRYFRDGDWNFNSVLMPYRTYERFPDTLFVDQFLQAICSDGVCHAAWMDDITTTAANDNNDLATTLINDDDDDDPHQQPAQRPAPAFSLREVRAVHLRSPKVPASLYSPQALRETSGSADVTSDVFADVGRYVLTQSGRVHLLDGSA